MKAPFVNQTPYSALVCDTLSDDFSGLSIQTLRTSEPAADEVLIRVRSAALNFPDVLMTQGKYQFKPPMPFVPGLESSGEVVAVGPGVKTLAVGDRVVASTRYGALAQYLTANADEVRAMPSGFTWAQGAAYQAASLTAYVALVDRAGLSRGETLLVHGASGGVGMAAVQLGRHLGARVIATGRSDEKLVMARKFGAHDTIRLDADMREQVMRLTDQRGVDVVFDPVGGDVFDASLRCLGWGGRLLVVGFVSGRIPEVKANYILIKNISVIGVRAGEAGRRDPERGASNIREIDRLAQAGVFEPHVGSQLPLASAIDGMCMLQAGSIAGKLVIDL